MQAYMTIFGQEGLGRPESDADGQMQAMKKFLAKSLEETALPPIRAALVFTNDQAAVEPGDSPLPAVHIRKLKDFVRQAMKSSAVHGEALARIKASLPES